MNIQPVFILGEQRSGTNLLRLILNKSQDVIAPHPPHIIPRLLEFVPYYGDLLKDANFKSLINDICLLIETNPVPWNIKLDREKILNKVPRRSIWAVYEYIMNSYAIENQAKLWVCKSMENAFHIPAIEASFQKPKYIFLFRDPRDVALSFQKTIIGNKHPYLIAKKWQELQEFSLSAREKVEPERFFSLKYETLIKFPESTISSLCHYLQIDFDLSMLEYYNSDEATNTASVGSQWENVKKPIQTNNSRKYLNKLSENSIHIIESVCATTMEKLGYHRNYESILNFTNSDIVNFEEQDILMRKETAHNFPYNELKKREQQQLILSDIQKKFQISTSL